MDTLKTVTVAAIPTTNFMEIYSDADGTKRAVGLEAKFLTIVLTALGMDYRIVIPEDGEFGIIKKDGNFTGVIGMVARNEADIGTGMLDISEQRASVVDFSRPCTVDGVTFMIKKPRNINSVFAFVYPFDADVWFGICATVISLTVLCYVLGGGWCFFKLLSSILRQKLELGDGTLKWRFLVGFWLLFTLVVTSSYSSALLSFLTLPISGPSIDNFQELSEAVQRGTYRCFALKGSYCTTGLKASINEKHQVLGQLIEKNNWFYKSHDLATLERFVDTRTVVVESMAYLKLFFDFRKDRYLMSKDVILLNPTALALNKNFCCKKKLDSIISRIEGSGILDKLLSDLSLKLVLASLKSEDVEKEERVKRLTVKDVSGCLVILVAGWVLSLKVLVGEIVFFRVSKNFRKIT